MLRLRVLGTPGVESDGPIPGAAASQRKSLALLALLAQPGGCALSRDKLLGYLWPEVEPARAAHRLTQLIYALRRDLSAPALLLGSTELRLNPAVIGTDVGEFAAALARGEPERAVALYRGPFLDGFFLGDASEFDRWVEDERADCGRQYRRAIELVAEAAARRGDMAEAAEHRRRRAKLDPLDSRLAVVYLDAAAAAGDRSEALQFARAHERLVRQELGTAPDPEVLAAVERLRVCDTSVAVLPFLNLSPETENEYFSDGMTEELTNLLARVPGLRVTSRTSAFTFKGSSADVREIAGRLRVGAVVEGSVRKVGDRIRVAAQLVDAGTGFQRWSQTYERRLENVFALQEELARSIVQALPMGGGPGQAPMVRPSTGILEAYTYYLQGRYHALKRTVEGLTVGVEYLEQAAELDPAYALAHAGLAECWALRGFEEFGDLAPLTVLEPARAAAARALELDDRLPEGYLWRGVVRFLYQWRWDAAESDFLEAIELRPTYSFAHAWYALFLAAMGRTDEALSRIMRAAELDPLSLSIQAAIGNVFYYARRFNEALARHAAVLQLEPQSRRLHVWRARALIAAGREAEALARVEDSFSVLGRHPLLLEQAGRALASLGRRPAARRIIEELRELGRTGYLSPWPEASIQEALGNRAAFQSALERLVEQRSGRLAFLRSEPSWDRIRLTPWFERFLRRLTPID